MKKHILFTGPPGCGKTTLVERIVSTAKARDDVAMVRITDTNRDELAALEWNRAALDDSLVQTFLKTS